MDVGKLQISVDLNADDLAAEITKAVEKQLEPVLIKIREQINATARDLNKIDGKKFIEVAVDAKAAQSAVDAQGRASAKAAVENEANAKALRDLAKAEAEFAAAQKSGDLVARTSAMAKLTQATKDYETVTGRSAGASRDFATKEVQNLDNVAKADERRSTVSKRTANAQVANHKAIQDALNKTAEVAERAAERRAKAEQKVRDEISKTEKAADAAAKREAERMAARAAGGGRGGGSGGGGGGGGSSGGGTGVYGGKNFVTRFAMNPIGANVIGAGLAGIPAATLVVTDLVQALGQLSQVGLLIPGIFAGVGASVGTLALGLSGMKKATTDLITAINAGDPKGLEKANEELKDMAPAARDTANAIAALATGPIKQLKQEVQGKLFAGTAAEIKQLGDVLIPHLTTGMGNIATAWNRTFKAIGAAAIDGGNVGLLDRILGNTAQAQSRFNAAIMPLTHGMASLAATGTDFLPRLADGLTKVSTRFDAFINKSTANGNLDKWIDASLTGFTHLGNAAINFGKTLQGIFTANGNRNFLEWLDKATQRWAQFTNSAKGQEQLKAFFKEAADDLHRWEPVLGNLFKLLGQIIGGAQAWSAVMLPFLTTASSLLLHMPGLVSAVTVAFLAWRTLAGVSKLADMLGGINGHLTAMPAKAAAAGAAVDAAGGGAGGGASGGGAAGRGRGGRMGRLGQAGAALGLGIGLDQLMQGVDPGNQSGQGTGGWLQSISGGAATGLGIGAMAGPEGAAIGAAIGAVVGPALKGILDMFKSDPGQKPLVPGALTGQDYQNALNQNAFTAGPGGAPWNQKLTDQAVYGTSGSFDPRNSAFAQINKGDANYQSVLTEMQKPGGAYASIPGLTADNAPQYLDRIVKQAHDAAGALNSLGGEITDLPTGEVVITDPTPQILDRIRSMGGELHSLPNGLISVDTTQLNDAEKKADELHEKLAKLLVPGMQLDPNNPNALIPAGPSNYGTPANLPPGLAGLFPGGPGSAIPGRYTGGIIRHFDDGGTGDAGGSPWRVAAQIGSQFIDEATMVAIKAGQAAMKGGSGLLGTAANVAGKVIGPVGIAAPFAMDAIEPQARTSASDTMPFNRGPQAPASDFAGMLPGYSPGQDNMSLPLYGGGKYALSGGEGVIIPEAMKALGPDWLYQINSQFRPGLPKGNYASGGILGRFAPGGVGGGGGGLNSTDDTNDILKSISALLGGSKYGPLTAMQYSGVLQQQYLQRIASGGALNGTLAPGTTPGHVGPFGTPVKPINKMEAMMRGAIQGLGGNPDIVMGPDSVDYAIQQSNTIESALKQAAGQPGGIAGLSRPSDPAAYTDALTKFAQTGVITPEMQKLGLDANSPIVGALQTARMEPGDARNDIPALIRDSLSGGGYTGPMTDKNKGLLGALGTFRDQTEKNGLSQQQLNMTLAPYGGIPALPGIIAQNPQLQAIMPGGGAPGGGAPGGAAGGAGGLFQKPDGTWHSNDPWWEGNMQAESGGRLAPPENPDHFGLFQFSQSTWDGVASAVNPAWVGKNPGTAPADVQAQMAQENYNRNKGNLSGQWANGYVRSHPEGTSGSVWSPGGAAAPAAPPTGALPVMPPLALSGPSAPGDTGSTAPPTVPPGKTALWLPAENTWKIDGQPVPGAPPANGAPQVLTGPPVGGPPPPTLPVVPPPALPGGVPSLLPGQTASTGLPGLFGVIPGAPAAGPPAERPDNTPAPAGMTWSDTEHKWVPVTSVYPAAPAPPVVAPPAMPQPQWAPGQGPDQHAPLTVGTPPAVPGMPAAPAALTPGAGGFNLSTIPVAAQKYANDCIDASARIILSHAGNNLDEDALMRVIAPGGTISSQAAGLNQLNPAGGYQAMEGSGGNSAAMFAAIKASIDKGAGSILNVAPGSSIGGRPFSEGHFIAATGYNPDGSINLSDSAGGGRQYSVTAEDAFQATRGRGIVAGTGTGPAPVQGPASPLAAGAPGTIGPGYSGAMPGSGGQFGAGGVFGGGGGIVPVLVTNWPGGGGGGFGGFGGGAAMGQAANIAAGVAAPVLGAAGQVAGNVAGDAINATPSAFQSVFETPAGINAPAVQTVSAFRKGDAIQGLLAAAGVNVPDLTRNGAVGLGGLGFEQGGAGTGGAGYDSEGRLLSATTGLYQRTSSDLNATLVAMRDQVVGATTSVGDKLTKTALTPLLKAGVSAGMGAIPAVALAGIGGALGTAMAPPIAAAVQSGGNSGTSSDISALPFNATAATFQGLNTLVMASGGAVTGGVSGMDSVPILGMPGEWMLTVDEVTKLGGEAGARKFTDALKKSNGVKYMAAGGAVSGGASGGPVNPGTAGTGTGTLGGDYFGLSQVPLIGGILDVLINILLTMMGISVSVRDTMNDLTDNFRQFRGDSFKAFTAQGQLLNDTSGLIDRSQTSTDEVVQQRILILTKVLEGVITYIINKVVIPLSEAVANAAISAAASAGGGALNAVAPGAGSAAGAAASALGQAGVQITGQIATDFFGAAIPAISDAVSTGLIQNGAGDWLSGLLGGSKLGSGAAPVDTAGGGGMGALAGGIAGLLVPLLGLGGLATDTTGALFDSGGMASGIGMMPKATIAPERVLGPQMTQDFERLVDVLQTGKFGGQNTTTVHAPITVQGNADAGRAVRDSLLSLI